MEIKPPVIYAVGTMGVKKASKLFKKQFDPPGAKPVGPDVPAPALNGQADVLPLGNVALAPAADGGANAAAALPVPTGAAAQAAPAPAAASAGLNKHTLNACTAPPTLAGNNGAVASAAVHFPAGATVQPALAPAAAHVEHAHGGLQNAAPCAEEAAVAHAQSQAHAHGHAPVNTVRTGHQLQVSAPTS